MEAPQTEKIILNSLFTREDYMRKVVPFLSLKYFEQPYKDIFRIYARYVTEYNQIPDKIAFAHALESSSSSLTVNNPETKELIDDLFRKKEVNTQWIIDTTENWCQEKALYNAIMESIDVIDGKNAKLKKDAIPEILQTALNVKFDLNVGHDYFEAAEQRYDEYQKVEEKTPFDLKIFNDITSGGIVDKSLTVILASTGVGKSMFMCHMSANAISQGKNVLYITMEMAEERIAERIDANLFDIPIKKISQMTKDTFLGKVRGVFNRIQKLVNKTKGRLIIKEYPTSSAHSGHFRALLKELKTKKNFEPDMIFIDYINICCSSRMKIGGSVNSYTYIKCIAEELRGLAMEFDVPVVTATQMNREGSRNSDPDLDNTSESWGLPATADLMFALVASDELAERNQIMVKQLKNRYNDINECRKFIIGVDKPKMKFYDVENQNFYSGQKEEDTGPVFDNSEFGNKTKAERFDSFKV